MSKKLFITFDDGPKKVTSEILDILKKKACPSTFFLTGSGVAGIGEKLQRELCNRILGEGHVSSNHCYNHFPAKLADYKSTYGDLNTPLQKSSFKKNIDDNIAHFRTLLSKPSFAMPLVRLPGDGRFHKPSVDEVGALGHRHIAWDYEFAPNGALGHIKESDWQGIKGVACTFKALPPANSVVLVHDAHWAGKMALLEALLQKFIDEGYSFGGVV
jgi:peptidoglycan/xylan/chitin deacetylase (PgdA/CDA1 family)